MLGLKLNHVSKRGHSNFFIACFSGKIRWARIYCEYQSANSQHSTCGLFIGENDGDYDDNNDGHDGKDDGDVNEMLIMMRMLILMMMIIMMIMMKTIYYNISSITR